MYEYIVTDNLSLYINDKRYIVVFGDNLIEKGFAGTATVRGNDNVVGIPTKRYPCLNYNCFFKDRDDEIAKVAYKLKELKQACSVDKIAVFPMGGLGNGLAHMSSKSPGIYKAMNFVLLNVWGFDNNT